MDGNTQFEREVRFAVVIYGGVSLAIYINGVAQEMLRLVRSTAVPAADLKYSERVYRKLACILGLGNESTISARSGDMDDFWELYLKKDEAGNEVVPTQDNDGHYSLIEPETETMRTRFVIDILSGTSAGGINAIYLAKALANRQQLDRLAGMWINVADISKLLNDRGSAEPPVKPQTPPPSLLNSRWMYLQLLYALDGMDIDDAAADPMVDELDLFATTTDLDGVRVSIPLADRSVDERRYKNVFQFHMDAEEEKKYAKREREEKREERSHFGSWNNPFLAFAARCTSAFPFAFEPMKLSDIFPIIQRVTPHAERRYHDPEADYWSQFYLNYLPDEPGRTAFQMRPFGDGGYLDNKPFTYAIETILKRRADLPVDRKLVYIEPSPEDPISLNGPDRKTEEDRPDAIQNSLKALIDLPRYETIRQDLEKLIEWNTNVSRIRRVMNDLEKDLGQAVLDKAQPAYKAYTRLRLSSVTDSMANKVARVFNIDKESGEAAAIRVVAGVWRDKRMDDEKKRDEFLNSYDIEYCRRAIRHARRRVRWAHLKARRERSSMTVVKEDYKRIRSIEENLLQAGSFDVSALKFEKAQELSPDDLKVVMDPGEVSRRFEEIHDSIHEGDGLSMEAMRTATEAGKSERAKWLLEKQGWEAAVGEIHDRLSSEYGKLLEPVREALESLLADYDEKDGFELRDSVLFPVTFGTDLGEVGPVDITRISPRDAEPLKGIDRDPNRGALKGDQFAAFGGFLDQTWRLHDMLRGRLDGADRLISAILPGSDKRTTAVREALITEAQEQIAEDWKARIDDLIKRPPSPAPASGRFLDRAERFFRERVRGR
jgi:hypothetical protein